jgi:hypothetical protein
MAGVGFSTKILWPFNRDVLVAALVGPARLSGGLGGWRTVARTAILTDEPVFGSGQSLEGLSL